MGIGTADEAREPGQTVDNVIAVRRRSGSLSWLGSRRRQRCDNDSHSRERNDFRPWSHHGKDDHTYNTMPVGDQILRPRVGGHPIMRSLERGNTLELGIWSSNRKRVTTMARMLAAGNSVTPTISKCYSFPDLVRKSDRGMRSKNSERGGMGRESPFSPERLAMKALTTFRRLGQAPLSQPDGLFINSSRMPEALKAVDLALDDATIAAWMKANGFDKHHSEASFEALSWTEYCRALSELCPAFRRSFFNIPTANSTKHFTLSEYPANNAERPAPSCHPTEDKRGGQDPQEAFFSRGNDHTLLCDQVRGGWGVSESYPGRSPKDVRNQFPPRSPGADCYRVLRRKRQVAISVDYESATMEAPQVMPQIDPSLLVDHIKTLARWERKTNMCEGGDLCLWTLAPHERLTRMSLQKSQVSETANPQLVQARQVAVRIRSRRSEFIWRRDAGTRLVKRFSSNAGVIGRHAKLAEARATERKRLECSQKRVANERSAEARRSAFAQMGAEFRDRDRKLKAERLKKRLAEQLGAVEKKESRVLEQARARNKALRKRRAMAKSIN